MLIASYVFQAPRINCGSVKLYRTVSVIYSNMPDIYKLKK